MGTIHRWLSKIIVFASIDKIVCFNQRIIRILSMPEQSNAQLNITHTQKYNYARIGMRYKIWFTIEMFYQIQSRVEWCVINRLWTIFETFYMVDEISKAWKQYFVEMSTTLYANGKWQMANGRMANGIWLATQIWNVSLILSLSMWFVVTRCVCVCVCILNKLRLLALCVHGTLVQWN